MSGARCPNPGRPAHPIKPTSRVLSEHITPSHEIRLPMRHHLFPGTIAYASPGHRRLSAPITADPPPGPPQPDKPVDRLPILELRDLVGWLRQRLAGEHTVRACVIAVEPAGNGSCLLMLGEADAVLTAEPPRLTARLNPSELAVIREQRGAAFDPASLADSIVVLTLRTGIRHRFGKGLGVQAKVVALEGVEETARSAALSRDRALAFLRSSGLRFGPQTWDASEDPCEIAVIASEHGEARRDVAHQLQALEQMGLLRVHWLWATFEGTGAQASLVAALERAAQLHAARGLSATVLVRGGGCSFAFHILNTLDVARAATAERIPNLIVGLGHAGTVRTALDEVAARSEPTPTAAARLVRDLVEQTGARAERALASLDDAIAHDLLEAGRIALARATKAFEAALQDLAAEAHARLRHLDREVEHALLGALAAATTITAAHGIAPLQAVAEPTILAADQDPDLEASLALVIDAETGTVITGAGRAPAGSRLLLQFTDGLMPVRVEPHSHPTAH
ncbi:exonuclease VII large subunit [Methylobacterium sp. J-026]|uniref:exodeoxyribonuclease VII large subunit n=1 Tax=Methylobacterium sp. J-026 TaxID=2836624 RepID=UPI001FBBDA07|nr:exodeoxyribonuclease VII large subunit [Methylobacterium sp. J-026]MCJ2136993.1 exonuclease VII large subunit [Methylobacterium sp. J-026]